MKLKRENRKQLKTRTKKIENENEKIENENENAKTAKLVTQRRNTALTGAMAVRH